MTLLDLKNFLNTLPEEFDKFSLVNGEEAKIDGEYYYRLDKPIVTLTVDEKKKEIVFLHKALEEKK